ncbi:MAG TPA: alkaline phosphatase PafA [Chitinophagaceae bacterium]|nr:alkaline phosphatase PafA [Chitinophagaceae bacterium]
MRKIFLLYISFSIASNSPCQNTSAPTTGNAQQVSRPKLVVGIVIDQMRWDYLYRYYDRYQQDGGFKQLLHHGFSCENTFIPYVPTVTACGHTAIYTGSIPAIDGIAGNEWWDDSSSQMVYCTQDDNVKTIGSATGAGKMSPHYLLVTTIGDELHLAANFQNKVVSIALKDRSSILPGGYSADGSYWYDEQTGDWITSSYYMTALPKWVKDLNAKKLVDSYYAQNWNTLYPLSSYTQSAPDEQSYEYRPFGANAKGFPYNLNQFVGKNYGILPVTPYGNTLTFEMAKAAINGERLGTDSLTDLLAISVSTPDYIGHTFGPNSVEAEDDFLRLDKELGDFLRFLDKQIGNGKYLVFLSADHGVAQVPAFLKEHKIASGNIDDQKYSDQLNGALKSKFNIDNLVIGIFHNQVYLDRNGMTSSHLDKRQVYDVITDFLARQRGISRAFPLNALDSVTLSASIKNIFANGYYPSRSGDIQIISTPQWIEEFGMGGTTHGVWNPYDSHIPLLWFGWNIQPGKTNRKVSIADIAPTIAAMLHIQMPSGSIGDVIEELFK